MKDIIVIGGGPSGMTAALYALRSNKSVLILEKENFGGQIANSPRVENYPTIKEISGLELSNQIFEQITALGVEFDMDDVQEIIKKEDHFEVKGEYSTYEAKAVILANGVKHRMMNLQKEEDFIGKGISFCALCDGAFYKGQDVYLIGDANTAIQYALLLADMCPNVYMFTLFDRFFGDQIIIDRLKAKENIHVTHNMNLIEYKGDKELEGLVFENTQTKEKFEYKTNNVFVCIGQVPQNDKFKDLVELDHGYIVTDENMCTKTPGLFACGDTRKKAVKQVITACNDGAIAAMSAVKYIG